MSAPVFDLHSDIHLEFRKEFTFAPQSDTLVLAGDICTTRCLHKPHGMRFWKNASSAYKDVIYVFGNHEHYGSSLEAAEREFRSNLSRFKNIHILQNEAVTIGDTSYLGATLWTDFGHNQAAIAVAQKRMNDFHVIANFAPKDSMALHEQSLHWLTDEVPKYPREATVIVTHHAPSYKSVPQLFFGSILNPAYVSSLDNYITEWQPAYWVHGHLHSHLDYTIGNTRVMCNPTGYPGELS